MRVHIIFITAACALFAGCIEDLERSRPDVIRIDAPTEPSSSGAAEPTATPSTPVATEPGWAPGTGEPTPPAVEPGPIGERETHLADCEAEEAWHTDMAPTIVQSGGILVSGDGRLFIASDLESGFGRMAFSGETGAPLFGIDPSAMGTMMGPHWETRINVEHDADGVRLHYRPVLEADALWTVQFPRGEQLMSTLIAPSGARVVTITCRDEISSIKAFSSLDGTLEKTVTYPDGCFRLHPFGMSSAVTSFRGDKLVLANHWGSEILAVDLGAETIDVLSSETMNPEGADGELGRAEIVSIALSPDGDAILVATQHGQLHRWSLPALEHTVMDVEIAAIDINQRTYMPLTVSPIVFSRDGALMAVVQHDLSVAVINTADETVVHTLETPDFAPFEPHGPQSTGGLPVALRFTDDASSLFVSYTSGMARFQCRDRETPVGHDALPVRLDGPRNIAVGQEVTFTATHLAGRSMHGHAFFLDGEPLAVPTTGREVVWTPTEAGEFTLEVQVMDGRDTGSTTMQIWVSDEG